MSHVCATAVLTERLRYVKTGLRARGIGVLFSNKYPFVKIGVCTCMASS